MSAPILSDIRDGKCPHCGAKLTEKESCFCGCVIYKDKPLKITTMRGDIR